MIEVANSLVVAKTNTPVIANERVNTLAEVESLPTPWVGLIFYCLATDKYYKVKSLKSLEGVANLAVNEYEEYTNSFPCVLNIRIPNDDGESLQCEIELSLNTDFSDAILLNTEDNSNIMQIAIDGVVEDVNSIIPAYAYTGILMVNLTEIDNFNPTAIYYARARFKDDSSYGTWNVIKFAICGYLEPASLSGTIDRINVILSATEPTGDIADGTFWIKEG